MYFLHLYMPHLNLALLDLPHLFSDVLLAICVFLVLLFSGLYLNYRARLPLKRMTHHLNHMIRGELPMHPLPVTRQDELGEISKAFNHLLGMLDTQSNELDRQKHIAAAATQEKSRFLASASHDLRQPMHALNLYLGALSTYDLPCQVLPIVDNIRYCAHSMDDMFHGLLDISRLDANAIETEISTFPIATLLNQIRMEFTPQAQAKKLTLRIATCSELVICDAGLVERILRNLVSNAVRYTSTGKILVGCRRTIDGIKLAVYDTGPGIAIDQQQSIFNEFYQVRHPSLDHSQGLGLGLAIVRRLAGLLNLPLTLQSQPGHGTVFSITLPRAAQKKTEKHATQAPILYQGSLAGTLIAIIDDEQLVLNATAALLQQWGCHIIPASSMSSALDRITLSPRCPDAIICDYRLNHTETGINVIEALRDEFNCDIPAVLITGETNSDMLGKIMACGLPVLHKPLQATALKNALHLILNQDQIRMQLAKT